MPQTRQEERRVLEIEGLSKDTVYNVMRELLYSFNYMWFLFEEVVKRTHPEELESEEFLRLNEEFGSYEAKRLSRVIDISAGGIDALIQLLKHSHWAVFENIEIKRITKKSFQMRTIECSTQKAAKRWGMEYRACGPTGSLIRIGFFKRVNEKVKVQRIFTPPEMRPEGTPKNVSCEWLISIEE
jgi:hypothetical protein